MNQYVTGNVIRDLRMKCGLTQSELADKINVSDKAVSKWETGKGYPDIALLEPLAKTLDVSVAELLSGNVLSNTNVSANMRRSKFYVCPVCGNVIHSMGEAVHICHGIELLPLEAERLDDAAMEMSGHAIHLDVVEDEYFVTIEHEMAKQHYISFVAAVSDDRLQMVKLYPEGNAEARFKISCVKELFFYCNRDGLFCYRIRKNRKA